MAATTRYQKSFSLTATRHPVFGVLAVLRVSGQPSRRFTRQEATILARALSAAANAATAETRIFMSPIASDQDFDAEVGEAGVTITTVEGAGLALDWTQTRELAAALIRFANRPTTSAGGCE